MQRLLGGDVGYERTETEKEHEAVEARAAANIKKTAPYYRNCTG
jgi:hypothetical protein